MEASRVSQIAPAEDTMKVFDSVTEHGGEIRQRRKSVSSMQSMYIEPSAVPEQLKTVMLPGISPMSQEALKFRLARPKSHVRPDFKALPDWYQGQNTDGKLYSPSEWADVNKHMQHRVRDRRKEAMTSRDTSVKLRSGNDTALRRKSIQVKNQFTHRKGEVDKKTMQLKLLKQKLDTERELMHGAVGSLDDFNKNRFQWPMKANQQCLRARARRIGIDLVADVVDDALKIEKEMLGSVSDVLDEAFNAAVELSEQMAEASTLLGEDIDRKLQAAQTDKNAEKMKLESANIELHVHTLQAPPKDATLYENWKTASEDLEAKSNESIATSKAMRTNMKKTQDESDAKVKHHDSSVFAALLRRTEEYDIAMGQDRKLLNEVKHEITTVLWEIEKCVSMIHSQEKPMMRTTTRLHKRDTGRSSPERTIDAVHDELLQEAKDISAAVDALKAEIATHTQNLTDLREMEVMLEEDLAIKTNSRKIEKKCVYHRSYFAKHKADKMTASR